MPRQQLAQAYWRENLRLVTVLLAIWFSVSFAAGIIFFEDLNAYSLGGYKLGLWFAQQGSIYTFVILIFVYAKKMAKLDKKYGLDEE
ncbi:DUF4212 domain-containing protein [uncultured Microbulbifer sp.]|uniref:DUF4212 domain-containing protein n=1 Tax=uncultured Microbulbifer sp. TaxID=348147 RepID=UPI002603F593|nr:DUF4212 domain-containing protein [uncultured Microbulbifer sp.]